jgi:hypothetical protein
MRDLKYPKDIDYLKDISKITITFDNINGMENLPFCYKYITRLNIEKNKLEKYIIFTFAFQLKLLTKCK